MWVISPHHQAVIVQRLEIFFVVRRDRLLLVGVDIHRLFGNEPVPLAGAAPESRVRRGATVRIELAREHRTVFWTDQKLVVWPSR